MVENKKRPKSNKRKSYILLAITSFFIFLTSLVSFNAFNVRDYIMDKLVVKSAGDVPTHIKRIESNEDGTYTLSLDVTGESEKKVNKANVIVIFDRSGSMKYNTDTYTATNKTGNGLYGLVNGRYVELTYYNNRYYYQSGYGYNEYSGQRYYRETRMDAAVNSVKGLAESLLANNKLDDQDTNNDDIIEMALVSFSTKATTDITKTNKISEFENALDGLEADGGTNWEAALANAKNVSFGDDNPTYVIFVSDGNPTFRNTKGNYGNLTDNGYYPGDDLYYDEDGVYGLGSDDSNARNYSAQSMTRCYNESVDDAQALVAKEYEFYTIGIYGNANRMQSLTTAAGAPAKNYYAADDTEALQDALNEILQKIETAGIGEVVVDDGTTKSVVATSGKTMQGGLLDVDKSTLKYWLSFPVSGDNDNYTSTIEGITVTKSGDNYVITDKDGNTYPVTGSIVNDKDRGKMFKFEWKSDVANPFYKDENDNPPAASVDDTTGEIKWDLSKLDVLSNQVTHTVTVEVWPSQVTLDIIADLKNGRDYDSLGDDVTKYLVKAGDGYSLYTNTEAKIDYADTRVSDQVKPSKYDVIDPVPTSNAEMLAITKEWKNDLDGRGTMPLNLIVNRDSESLYTVPLSEDNNWTDNVYISVGIMTVHDGVVAIKTTGHDYSFDENVGISHNWEFKTDTVHPMMINNTLTMLVKVDNSKVPADVSGKDMATSGSDTYYRINGSYYVVRGAGVASLTATNERRSYLQFTKEVTGEKIPEDSKFTYKVSVDSADDEDVWFSIKNGEEFITNTENETYVNGATAEIKEGTDDELTGYYYANSGSELEITIKAGWTVRFTNLPEGSTYSIEETEMPNGFEFTSVEGTREYTVVDADGKKQTEEESTGTINNKKISGTMSNANSKYLVTYKNNYLLTNVDVNKTWDDNNNQDGKRTTTVKVYLKANGELVDGQEVVLSDANNWQGSFIGVPRYNDDGSEIEYTVEEEVIEGYTPTITGTQKAGYSITNTHVPEKTDISVRKIWDDKENQDGFRKNITVTFVVNGEPTDTTYDLTSENNYTVSIEGLDKYIGGKLAMYSFTEEQVENYEEPVYSAAVNEGEFTITNKHTPETVNVEGTKTWDDNNNQDGMRPEKVTFNLMKKVGDAEAVEIDEVTLDVEDSMKYSFTDLPKREKGQVITYSVVEDKVEGYTPVAGEGYNIVNKHVPEKTDISVRKIWEDKENQDGFRKNITVTFVVNGVATDTTYELTSENNYTVSIEGLDKYIGGKLAMYSFTEEQVENYEEPVYSAAVNAGEFTITNKHIPETVNVEGTKTWDDKNNQDGMRPEKVTFKLMKKVGDAEAEEIDKVTLDVEDSMKYSFTDLPKREKGQVINYSVVEDKVEGYTPVAGEGYDIVNKHTPDTVDVEGTKTWEDNNNQDGKRPTTVTFNLMKSVDGSTPEEIDEVTLDVKESMKFSFTGLPKRENGKVITYSVVEDEVEGYTPVAGEGYNIVNKHVPEKTDISVRKIWDDNNNQDGFRKNITVTFVVNGEPTDTTYDLTSDNNYTVSIEGLDKYIGGKLAMYSFTEEQIENYEEPVYSDAVNAGEFTITNKHVPEKTDISVRKIWDDKDNQDGYRKNITVTFVVNGEATDTTYDLTSENNYTVSIEGLDKYIGGKLAMYSFTEEQVANYEEPVYSAAVNAGEFTITNKHTPETVNVEGTKTWDDNNNQDGMRPEKVTFNLMKKVGDAEAEEIDEVTLDVEDSMKYSFTDLPKRENGKVITYFVTEDEISNYTPVAGEGYDIVNTHTTEKTDISVKKVWDDNNNQDGFRKDIKVTLVVNGEATDTTYDLTSDNNYTVSIEGLDKYIGGKLAMYSFTEEQVENYEEPVYSAAVNAGEFTITNKHVPEKTDISVRKIWDDKNNQDGYRKNITVTFVVNGEATDTTYDLTSDNNYTVSIEGLDKYIGGKLAMYSFTEEQVENYEEPVYSAAVNEGEFTIINKHTPETVNVEGTKTWDDNNNQDGKRPTTVTFNLMKSVDGSTPEEVDEVTLDVENSMKFSFTELPKRENGKDITYTVVEDPIDGYTPVAGEGYDIVNKHIPAEISINITKAWNDNDNQDGKRPDSIEVILLADSKEVGTYTVTKDGGWTLQVPNLPKYSNGKEIAYTLKEIDVDDYSSSIDGFTITNTHTIEKTSICVKKEWVDDDDRDGYRTDVVVELLENSNKTGKLFTLEKDKGYTVTVDNLDKYKDGELINYSFEEITKLEEYEEPEYSDPVNSGTFTVTNTHKIETVDVEGVKTWDDSNNQDGKRPTTVTINLMKSVDGSTPVEINEVTLDVAEEMKYSFKGLPKNEKGKAITYSITEDPVEGYTPEYNGYNVVNKHTPELIDIPVQKIWNNDNNIYEFDNPESVKVVLYDNGEEIDSYDLNNENQWTHTFTGLPKYRDGDEIPYTVDEVDSAELTDYSKSVGGSISDGFTITNTYVMTPTDVNITKNWDDSLDQDGERPESIIIKLVGEAKGTVVYESEEVVLEGSNEVESWTYTFNNLSLKYLGEDIKYHVEEKLEDDTYTQRVDSEVEITNIYTPQTVSYSVHKTWEDNNNQDGKRPKTIIVYLYDGEELLQTQTISEEAGWTYTFENLPKFKEHGTLINYNIKEETVEYYEGEVVPGNEDSSEKTVEIINTHIPEVRDITVSKEWNDNDNQDGKRPESVTIHLLANGEEVNSVALSEDNNWTYTFLGLDKYANGDEILYTIEEDEVEDYTAEVDGFNVTNTHEIEKIDITIEKIWDDENDKNKFRPESIEVRVLANNEELEVITLSNDNNWKYTISDLDKYADGKEIVYTVEEVAVDNYTTKINGFVITNTVINPPEITPPDTWISVEDDSNKTNYYYPILLLLGIIGSIFTIKKVNE